MMIPCNAIEFKLRELGLQKSMFVEVHSSLSSFGKVAGGAVTVILALTNILTPEGAVKNYQICAQKTGHKDVLDINGTMASNWQKHNKKQVLRYTQNLHHSYWHAW